MNRLFIFICTSALLLAGCATTDGTRGAYDDGHYVAAHDGFGDYYYDQPQIVASYDPWYHGYGFGWYGAGYGPWGFGGWGPWFYGPPWYWHHHHHSWYATGVAAAGPAYRPAPNRQQQARRIGEPSGNRHESGIRAPRHGFEHQRP